MTRILFREGRIGSLILPNRFIKRIGRGKAELQNVLPAIFTSSTVERSRLLLAELMGFLVGTRFEVLFGAKAFWRKRRKTPFEENKGGKE